MPTPRPPLYDEAAHLERIRYLLRKRIDTLPLRALVKLSEAAILLEEGAPLGVLLARERLGKRRGKPQVQQREDVDRGQRTLMATSFENRELEEAARAEVVGYIPAWARRLGAHVDGKRRKADDKKAPPPSKR